MPTWHWGLILGEGEGFGKLELAKGKTCETLRSKRCKDTFSGCTGCVFPQQGNEAIGVCEVILVIKAIGVLWVLEDR